MFSERLKHAHGGASDRDGFPCRAAGEFGRE